MGRLKTIRTYIIWIIAFYIFSSVMIYIGLNATYKNILQKGNLPEQVNVDLAQATKVNGRIYGEVTSTIKNDLNGKYIKVEIYDKDVEVVGQKYLKIEGTNINEPKRFKVNFVTDGVKSYKIEILDDTPELQEEIEKENCFLNKFNNLRNSIFLFSKNKTIIYCYYFDYFCYYCYYYYCFCYYFDYYFHFYFLTY